MKRSNISEIYKKGLELINKKRLDDALKLFLELSKIDKKSSNIQLTISQIYKKKNDLINSKIHLKKSIKINPDNSAALNNLGNMYTAEFDLANAEKCFLKSSTVDKEYGLPLFNLATLYQTKGEFEKAKEFYKKAIKLDNKNFEFIYHLNNLDSETVTKSQTEFVASELGKINNFSYLNKASGYFFLAEKSRTKNMINEEIQNLNKAHYNFMKSDKNIEKIINYWLKIVPKIKDKIYLHETHNMKKDLSPIFITGLPRSGTTLVESIITSGKPFIPNGGETGILNKSITSLKKKRII